MLPARRCYSAARVRFCAQRFAIAVVCVQNADVYMIDEPSSYLDVKQRLKAARVIRGLCADNDKYVICVEHDLSVSLRNPHNACSMWADGPLLLLQESAQVLAVKTVDSCWQVLDYLSDFICCLYGLPGAYGVVTMPFNVRDGINIFLAGYIGPENIRCAENGAA